MKPISEPMEIESWKQVRKLQPGKCLKRTKAWWEYLRTHAEYVQRNNILELKSAPIRIGEIYDWIIENGVCLTGIDLEKTERQPFYGPAKIKDCYYNSMVCQSFNRETEKNRGQGMKEKDHHCHPRMECRRKYSNRPYMVYETGLYAR